MAYQTGTATDPNDLLSQIKEFAVANGWVVYAHDPDGAGMRLHIQKGNNYVNLKSAIGEKIFPDMNFSGVSSYGIGINGSTGFDSGVAWNLQPGGCVDLLDRPIGCGIPLPSLAIQKYHLFAFSDPTAIFGVVETVPGQFEYFGFGEVSKIGTWVGGQFVTASRGHYNMFDNTGSTNTDQLNCRAFSQESYANLFVHAEIDAFSRTWLSNSESNTTAEYGNTGKRVAGALKKLSGLGYSINVPHYGDLQSNGGLLGGQGTPVGVTAEGRAVNTLNCLSVILPFYLYAQRDPNSMGQYSFMGYGPHSYYCNMKYLAPGGIYELDLVGGEQYMVFPFSKKGGYMGYDGWAIKYQP